MTVEHIEKGSDILRLLKIWQLRYAQYQNRSLSGVSIHRNGCEDVTFCNSGSYLNVKFFNEVEIMFGTLCKEQIENLENQLKEL